jgi:hypothetical protein
VEALHVTLNNDHYLQWLFTLLAHIAHGDMMDWVGPVFLEVLEVIVTCEAVKSVRTCNTVQRSTGG